MKRTKLYFKNSDSEICKTRAYFYSYMEQNKLTEIEVFEAEPEDLFNFKTTIKWNTKDVMIANSG